MPRTPAKPASGAVYQTHDHLSRITKGWRWQNHNLYLIGSRSCPSRQKTLLIDTDSQANSSKVLLNDFQHIRPEQSIYAAIIERKPLPIRPSNIANLDIVPSHILLSNTDVKLTTAIDHREARLKSQLSTVVSGYEYIIIDCPPALSWLTINSFTASDKVLITFSPGYFELESIVQISKTIQEVREYFNPKIEVLGFCLLCPIPPLTRRLRWVCCARHIRIVCSRR